MEHPQDQTRGEPLFLINYINLFNSRGQFTSYLILKFILQERMTKCTMVTIFKRDKCINLFCKDHNLSYQVFTYFV